MPKILERLKPVNFGGKKINPYFLAGIVIFVLLIVIANYFHWAPSREINNAFKDINTEISKKIAGGLKVETKEQAVSSIGNIAQELEKAQGTLNALNKNLESGGKKQEPPSGLLVLGPQQIELATAVVALLAIATAFKIVSRRKPGSSLKQ